MYLIARSSTWSATEINCDLENLSSIEDLDQTDRDTTPSHTGLSTVAGLCRAAHVIALGADDVAIKTHYYGCKSILNLTLTHNLTFNPRLARVTTHTDT